MAALEREQVNAEWLESTAERVREVEMRRRVMDINLSGLNDDGRRTATTEAEQPVADV